MKKTPEERRAAAEYAKEYRKTPKYQEWFAKNSERRKELARAKYAADPSRAREKARKWREANPDRVAKTCRDWQAKNREYVKAKQKEKYDADPEYFNKYARRYRESEKYKAGAAKRAEDARKRNAERRSRPGYNAERRAERLALKTEVFAAYGGACACCGEAGIAFLTIDHITPVGKNRKRQNAEAALSVGARLYFWLKKNGYPKDNFRVLCFNCNAGRRGGPCPHEILRARASFTIFRANPKLASMN